MARRGMSDDQLIAEWHEWIHNRATSLTVQLVGNAQLVEAAEDWTRISELHEVPASQREDALLNCDAIYRELGLNVRTRP